MSTVCVCVCAHVCEEEGRPHFKVTTGGKSQHQAMGSKIASHFTEYKMADHFQSVPVFVCDECKRKEESETKAELPVIQDIRVFSTTSLRTLK